MQNVIVVILQSVLSALKYLNGKALTDSATLAGLILDSLMNRSVCGLWFYNLSSWVTDIKSIRMLLQIDLSNQKLKLIKIDNSSKHQTGLLGLLIQG